MASSRNAATGKQIDLLSQGDSLRKSNEHVKPGRPGIYRSAGALLSLQSSTHTTHIPSLSSYEPQPQPSLFSQRSAAHLIHASPSGAPAAIDQAWRPPKDTRFATTYSIKSLVPLSVSQREMQEKVATLECASRDTTYLYEATTRNARKRIGLCVRPVVNAGSSLQAIKPIKDAQQRSVMPCATSRKLHS